MNAQHSPGQYDDPPRNDIELRYRCQIICVAGMCTASDCDTLTGYNGQNTLCALTEAASTYDKEAAHEYFAQICSQRMAAS